MGRRGGDKRDRLGGAKRVDVGYGVGCSLIAFTAMTTEADTSDCIVGAEIRKAAVVSRPAPGNQTLDIGQAKCGGNAIAFVQVLDLDRPV